MEKAEKTLKAVIKESEGITEIIWKNYFGKWSRTIDRHDVAISGLFETMIEKASSILVLLDSKDYSSLEIISRSVFEYSIYLEYILEKQTKNRGKAYILNSRMEEKRLYDTLIGDNPESAKVRKFLNSTKEKISKNMKEQFESKNPGEDIDDFYDNLEKEYISCFKNHNPWPNQKWYSYNGKISSFYKLCKYLGKEAEYKLVYNIFSSEVHGSNTLKRFHLEPNFIALKHVESQIELISPIICLAIMENAKRILKYYKMEDELRTYKRRIEFQYIRNGRFVTR